MKNYKFVVCFLVFVVPAVLALVQPTSVPLAGFIKAVLVMVVLPALFTPVHEFGHFIIADYYARKNGYDVKLEMCYKCTKCNNWEVYREEELVFILQAGVQAVLLFAMYFVILSALSGQGLVTLEFFALAMVSVESNCTVGDTRDTDYYYLKYPDRLASEVVNPLAAKKIFQTVYVVLLFVVLNILILNHSL